MAFLIVINVNDTVITVAVITVTVVTATVITVTVITVTVITGNVIIVPFKDTMFIVISSADITTGFYHGPTLVGPWSCGHPFRT